MASLKACSPISTKKHGGAPADGSTNDDPRHVAKLWNLCHILRDDGVTYNEYVTELTFLLFLKMMAETGREDVLPNGYRWSQLTKRTGLEQLDYYKRLLLDLKMMAETGHEDVLARPTARVTRDHEEGQGRVIGSHGQIDFGIASAILFFHSTYDAAVR